MTHPGFYFKKFSERIRLSHPAVVRFLVPEPSSGRFIDAEVFHAPRGIDFQCNFLYVLDRGDTIEIAWSLPQTRGPAEYHWIETCPEDMELVSRAVQAVADILADRVVVAVRRYRFLWFEPYFLGTFHSASEASGLSGVDIVSWSGYDDFAQQFAATHA